MTEQTTPEERLAQIARRLAELQAWSENLRAQMARMNERLDGYVSELESIANQLTEDKPNA